MERKYEFLPDAINGKHALEIMRERRPDIIITDIACPR
jgi:YesN/AraC family two-component response regulator